ncbi:MAG: aminotransferase class III-fold pyridoxal phosphate-dependent enzyme [Muribaculaceae bacterium]|nr:aminotransferase class III-fold pyridoxal phosphate-dependent enzyme [Muribaculaceae bacterium]
MTLFDVYSLYDIEPVRGSGSHVYTADGTEYLDLYGGHAVISIGHAHPEYVKRVSDQVGKLGFYSNSVVNSLQEQLADRLGMASGYPEYTLFLCNSGAEANENAMKLASFATGRKKILAFGKAFHGRTFGAVAATDNPRIRAPFNETDHVDFTPLNDIPAMREALASREYAAAIIEGIQGVSGIHEPTSEFIKALASETGKTGTLLILDEIQSGYGRTGQFFAHQHYAIIPDIITCAKGIANGFPMGAVLIAPEIEAKKGMLGTTFGGNHLACAAALAVLDVMEREKLVENAAQVGEYLIEKLRAMPGIKEVRGRGLMIGFEAEGISGSELRRRLLFGRRIFTGGAGESTVRLLPALSLTREQADEFLAALEAELKTLETE